MDESLYDLAAVAERELQAVSGLGTNVSVNSASGVIARNLSNELKDLALLAKTEEDVCCICSTGVVTGAWACRSAGTAVQSINAAARTIATRNRRCENQSRCTSSLFKATKHSAMSFGSLWMHSCRQSSEEKDEGQSAC